MIVIVTRAACTKSKQMKQKTGEKEEMGGRMLRKVLQKARRERRKGG